jgi:hypothetical protein
MVDYRFRSTLAAYLYRAVYQGAQQSFGRVR